VQGVVAVKLVLEEGFFDATCPNIQEEEEACLSCQDVVLNLLSFPQVDLSLSPSLSLNPKP
jgi:hypothetical protein